MFPRGVKKYGCSSCPVEDSNVGPTWDDHYYAEQLTKVQNYIPLKDVSKDVKIILRL